MNGQAELKDNYVDNTDAVNKALRKIRKKRMAKREVPLQNDTDENNLEDQQP